jgi:hypothetical protein
MEIKDEFELTPEQQLREQAVLTKFQELTDSDRSRYETQAKKLIDDEKLETEILGFKLSYRVKSNSYLCQIYKDNQSENIYEIEFPIPDSDQDKLESLIELFAQSEAGRISQ